MSEYGPFDADELVRWAENYGHPEGWAKKAQALHGQNELMRGALAEFVRWFDARYPAGQSAALPGVTLYMIVSQARRVLKAKGT